jgi:adenosylmethionine-8-amino-7-oxononanoate aminotransferase
MTTAPGDGPIGSRVWLPYAQMKTTPAPLAVERSLGTRFYLRDGRVLVDGISNWWTACHGHSHPWIVECVQKQLGTLPHVMLGGLIAETTATLADRLVALLPGSLGRVFFAESGSVSVEVGLKIALQYWIHQGEPERRRFVSFYGAYHGDTFATMSICDPEDGMHTLFRGALAEQILATLPDTPERLRVFDALLCERRREIAAVVLEPLAQCAGGMRFHSPDTLRAVADTCTRHGIRLFLDEIATGFGRTGTLFACEQAEVVPDLIALSKALTGGTLPLAATIANEAVYEAFLDDDPERALMHGPTFSGNAAACAAANASLDLFEREPRLEQVAAIETQLREELAKCRGLPGVVEVRVLGALGVVQLESIPSPTALRERFVERGAWIRPFGDVVYLAPPFVIEPDDLSRLTGAIYDVLASGNA